MTSGIPSKVRAGGQSSQRFHRITEGLTKEFYKRIADEMKKTFLGMPKLKGILIGGPIPTKDEFLEGEYLIGQLQQKVMGKIDLGDSSESGLRELVERSQELLVNHERLLEKKEVEVFFRALGEQPEKAALGEKETRKALEMGAVEILYLSSELPKNKVSELSKLAENIGSTVKIISTETPEGEQFFNMGGVGATLRFSIG
ncbi:MAG: Vms1/Ankzf1 family peptidyl-tRNA hydrolase [Candidatus Pacearchaeota archaeon]|nr:Vms1/Ankzf1 family peptidyl-tRNA hydrolase [Candidatus Pacearchaeota archaeon]